MSAISSTATIKARSSAFHGIRDHPMAPRSPWQNGHVERHVVKTCRLRKMLRTSVVPRCSGPTRPLIHKKPSRQFPLAGCIINMSGIRFWLDTANPNCEVPVLRRMSQFRLT
jgi:hypothetical protein